MKKTLLTLIFSVTCLTAVWAQEPTEKNICETGNVIYFDFGGGVNNICYDAGNYGTKSLSGGILSRLGYKYFFSPNLGVGIGVSYYTFSGKVKLDFTETQYGIIDEEILLTDKTRDYHTVYSALKERQKEQMLNIPIGVFCRVPIGLNFKFNGGLTASYGYAFKQKFETKGGNFKTTADYKSVENGVPVNLNGLENLPNHGLTTFDEFKGDANLKQHLFGIGCEAGFGYCITHNLDLNLGVYFNYFFTDQKEDDKALLYDHSVSVYNGATQTKIAGEIRPLALGCMVGLSYRFTKLKTKNTEKALYNCEQEVQQLKSDFEELKRSNDKLKEAKDDLEKQKEDLEKQKEDLEKQKEDLEKQKLNLEKQTPQSFNDYVPNNATFEDWIETNIPIYFDINAITGDAKLMSKMDAVAAAMKHYPTRKIVIEGHTCDLGTHESNMRLSLRRAETLKKELVKRGVGPLRISVVGVAEKDPLVPNTSEENRRLNRCAIIKAE